MQRKLNTGLCSSFLTAAMSIGYASHAIIPNTITGSYTVSTNDVCPGVCTVMPGATLTITNGATATFNGHIFVKEHGKLIVQNSTVLMPVNGRIVLYADNDAADGYVGASLAFEGSKFSCSAPQGQGFWSGIEVMRNKPSSLVYNESSVYSDLPATPTVVPSVIERANAAIRNYNKDDILQYHLSAGGWIWFAFTTFKNNHLCADIRNEVWGATLSPVFNQTGAGLNGSCSFQKVDFLVDNTYNSNTQYPQNPEALVRLTNCRNVTFGSCRFKVTNQALINTMVGIRGINSSAYIYQYQASYDPNNSANTNYRCEFSGLYYGVHAMNALQTDRIWAIVQSDFHCKNDIYMSGCFKPYVIYNRSYKDMAHINFFSEEPISLYMQGCTSYTVESNTFYHNNTASGAGIVVNGSGTAYNEIYRNTFPKENAAGTRGLLLGIQSIGTNRNINATNGLKFICNDIYALTKGYDISVVKRPFIQNQLQLGQGISNNQFDQTTAQWKSAGNIYRNTDAVNNHPHNYYIENNTNTLNGFQYRIWNNPANNQLEIPTWRSLFNVVANLSQNTCPKRIAVNNDIAAMPVYPHYNFSAFASNMTNIESSMIETEAIAEKTVADMEMLSGLYAAQALLTDSIVNYYLQQDALDTTGTKIYLDSVARVYAHINVGYQFKLYQAATLMSCNRMQDAIDLLSNLEGSYPLTEAEAQEVSRVAAIYAVQQWLAENAYDWAGLPESQKELVYLYEAGDETSAGAIARSLLAQYEDKMYHAFCIAPEEEREAISMRGGIGGKADKLYPSPAKEQLNLLWKKGKAQFTLTDIAGRVLISKCIENGLQQIDICNLRPGLYFAVVRQKGKTVYQQKIVKN